MLYLNGFKFCRYFIWETVYRAEHQTDRQTDTIQICSIHSTDILSTVAESYETSRVRKALNDLEITQSAELLHQWLLVVSGNSVWILYQLRDIASFAGHMPACNLAKSFSFENACEITGHVHVGSLVTSCSQRMDVAAQSAWRACV